VLLGFLTLFVLTDRPAQAGWLRAEERTWLVERLQTEQAEKAGHSRPAMWQALVHPRVLLLSLLYLVILLCGYGATFWAPLILQQRSMWSPSIISLVGAIPALIAAPGMVAVAARSDRTGDHRRHVAATAGVAVVGYAFAGWVQSPVATLIAFSLVWVGIMSIMGPFWSLCSSLTTGRAAAVGIAAISSIGNVGAFVGPSIMGALRGATAGFSVGLWTLAGGMLVAVLLALAAKEAPAPARQAEVVAA
jgi:ACS family tartrate transporter-like MFS transporter